MLWNHVEQELNRQKSSHFLTGALRTPLTSKLLILLLFIFEKFLFSLEFSILVHHLFMCIYIPVYVFTCASPVGKLKGC